MELGWVGLCTDMGSAFVVKCFMFYFEFPVPDGDTVFCGCDDREWGAIPESSGHEGSPESTWLMLKIEGELYGCSEKPIGKVKSQERSFSSSHNDAWGRTRTKPIIHKRQPFKGFDR